MAGQGWTVRTGQGRAVQVGQQIQDLTLGGAWTFSTGGGRRKSLKVLKVEVKDIFSVFLVPFGPYFF